MRARIAAALVPIMLALGACTSPEADRVRGGGNGSDVRNVGEVVQMHAGSQPYWDTPRLVKPEGPTPAALPRTAPAEPASQDARERR